MLPATIPEIKIMENARPIRFSMPAFTKTELQRHGALAGSASRNDSTFEKEYEPATKKMKLEHMEVLPASPFVNCEGD